MPELQDIINEVPESILNGGDGGAAEGAAEDEEVNEDGDADADADADAADADNADDAADADADADDASDADDADEDDYITSPDDDEDDVPVTKTPPAVTPPAATDENTFILQGLQKISVNVIVPNKDGEDEVQSVQVYGYGDLPRNYKGFASKYEEGIFNQSVIAQETRARELQTQYRQTKIQADMNEYTRKENQAIADDLTELRTDGIFPKFKGKPGTKEFNESEGAKMFDKVVAYQNKMNRQYQEAANSGKSFRHIGFREAFIMLNGPNIKSAEKADAKTRRAAASRVKGGRGTGATERIISTEPVQNMGDLVGEFVNFAGKAS